MRAMRKAEVRRRVQGWIRGRRLEAVTLGFDWRLWLEAVVRCVENSLMTEAGIRIHSIGGAEKIS